VDLFAVLAQAGAPLVLETLAGLEAGTLHPRPQDHSQATLAPILRREDGLMDFAARTAAELSHRWRGFQPWPGAFTTLEGKKLIVHRMKIAEESGPADSGQIRIENHRFLVACANHTWIELLEVQLEGKKRLPAADFLRGTPLLSGARLG
jgi:methionyl-tRNA formyltransferase